MGTCQSDCQSAFLGDENEQQIQDGNHTRIIQKPHKNNQILKEKKMKRQEEEEKRMQQFSYQNFKNTQFQYNTGNSKSIEQQIEELAPSNPNYQILYQQLIAQKEQEEQQKQLEIQQQQQQEQFKLQKQQLINQEQQNQKQNQQQQQKNQKNQVLESHIVPMTSNNPNINNQIQSLETQQNPYQPQLTGVNNVKSINEIEQKPASKTNLNTQQSQQPNKNTQQQSQLQPIEEQQEDKSTNQSKLLQNQQDPKQQQANSNLLQQYNQFQDNFQSNKSSINQQQQNNQYNTNNLNQNDQSTIKKQNQMQNNQNQQTLNTQNQSQQIQPPINIHSIPPTDRNSNSQYQQPQQITNIINFNTLQPNGNKGYQTVETQQFIQENVGSINKQNPSIQVNSSNIIDANQKQLQQLENQFRSRNSSLNKNSKYKSYSPIFPKNQRNSVSPFRPSQAQNNQINNNNGYQQQQLLPQTHTTNLQNLQNSQIKTNENIQNNSHLNSNFQSKSNNLNVSNYQTPDRKSKNGSFVNQSSIDKSYMQYVENNLYFQQQFYKPQNSEVNKSSQAQNKSYMSNLDFNNFSKSKQVLQQQQIAPSQRQMTDHDLRLQSYDTMKQDMQDIRTIISQKVQKFGSKMFSQILYYFDKWESQIYDEILDHAESHVKTFLTSNRNQKVEFLKVAHEIKNFSCFGALMDFLKQYYIIQFNSNVEISSTKQRCDAQISIEFLITQESFLKIMVKFINLEEPYNQRNVVDNNQLQKNIDLQYTPKTGGLRVNEFQNNLQQNPELYKNSLGALGKDEISYQINQFASILKLENLGPVKKQQCAECILQLYSILTNQAQITGSQLKELQDLKNQINQPKQILICENVINQFINLSQFNTESKQIETLGFIAGYEKGNLLIGDQLIIPAQVGKYDTCELLNEDMLPDFLEKVDRLLIAWIHTHPKHGQFLSAVDLHNQYMYQVNTNNQKNFMALVYSPQDQIPLLGYQLTNQGLQEIGLCYKQDFHDDHKKNYDQLVEKIPYENIAYTDPNIKVEIFDFRQSESQVNNNNNFQSRQSVNNSQKQSFQSNNHNNQQSSQYKSNLQANNINSNYLNNKSDINLYPTSQSYNFNNQSQFNNSNQKQSQQQQNYNLDNNNSNVYKSNLVQQQQNDSNIYQNNKNPYNQY